MQVHNLKASEGARKTKRIVGRGESSGRGKTCGRGHKGQKARAGRGILGGSEGGQMALIRRLPKFGFRSHRPVVYQWVKVGDLNRFKKNEIVDAKALREAGLIHNIYKPFKILGNGELKVALEVKATSFSKTAKEKIEQAGGKTAIFDKTTLKKQLAEK